MTLEEALKVLALDEAADEAATRRAYLRAVKRHPPERDPEGFMRVRAAYERAGAALRARRFPAEDGAEARGADVRDTPPSDAVDAQDTEPNASGASEARAASGPAASDDADAGTVAASAVGLRERIARCREAVRVAPDSADARHDLVLALEEAGKDAEAAREIYDAARAGVPGFIERLLHEMPDRATTRMLEHAEQAESPWLRMAAAAASRTRGDPLRAARILLGILEDARAEPLPAPLVWSCIATARELLRAGEFDAAVRLRDVLSRSFSDHGTELATLAGDTAAEWAIVSELIALHPYVPPTLWPAFLAPLEDAPLDRALSDIRRFADEHRLVLQQLSFACERLAPTLFSLFAAELTPAREDAVKARIRKLPGRTAVAFWAVVIVVLVVVWGLLRGSPRAENERTAPEQEKDEPLR